VPLRAIAGVGAAALTAWAFSELPLELGPGGALPLVDPAAAAAVAGLAAALLPRLAWILGAALLMVAVGPDRTALVIAAAAAPVVLLLPRTGALWSLPGAAPLLGVIGLAGAYPALAGQAAGVVSRAALGALGAWWLALATVVTDERPDLDVLAEPATFAIAGVWAVAAALLPLVVRGRRLAFDLVGAAVWAALLASATPAAAEALSAQAPRGVVVGAVVGAVLAIGAQAFRREPVA
jgi:hypothetical protein